MLPLSPNERIATIIFKAVDDVTPHEVLTTKGRLFDVDIARDGTTLYAQISGGGFSGSAPTDDGSVVILGGTNDRTPVGTISQDEAVRLLMPVISTPYRWCEGCDAAIPLSQACSCDDETDA